MIIKLLRKLFKPFTYGEGLEKYITERNPQSNGDVERFAFEYQQKYVRNGL